MLGKLFLLFTGVTLVELFLLIQLGRWMGLGGTLVLIVATGFVGAWLARREGVRVLFRIRQDLVDRRVPTNAVMDALLVLLASAFLITPGVLTDGVGFGLLFAPVRAPLKDWLRARFRRWIAEGKLRFVRGGGPFGAPRRGREAEIIDVSTDEPPRDNDEPTGEPDSAPKGP
jgi:UPF0716 protein FxsA